MTTTEKTAPVTAYTLVQMLRARYAFPEWVVEEEVTIAGRRIDVLAFNQWASRRRVLLGFEVKVARADWMRELADYEKGAATFAACDQFWIVTAKGVVQKGEVPSAWGWMEQQGSRLMTRQVPDTAKLLPSPDMPRELAARFLTRYVERVRRGESHANAMAREEIRKEIRGNLERDFERQRESERKELAQLRTDYEALLTALGVDRRAWPRHAEAMRAAGVLARYERDAGAMRRRLEAIAKELREQTAVAEAALAALPARVEAA